MRYFIGIDQSLSCSGLVVLDNDTKKVIESVNIKATPNKPVFVVGKENFSQTSTRVNFILSKMEDVFKNYDPEETFVCMEHLASNKNKSRDTDYVLSHLFFSLISLIDMYGFNNLIVSPNSHKKLVFPTNRTEMVKKKVAEISKIKKTIDKKVVEHDLFFEDGLVMSGFSREDEEFLDTYDTKDGFCLAYFGMRSWFCNFNEVFTHRTPKQKAIGDNYQLDALRGALCSATKRSSGCWGCVAYDRCKDKAKYKESKSTLKKWLRLKDLQRGIVEDYIKNPEDRMPKQVTLEDLDE
jgi:hypothetical protein